MAVVVYDRHGSGWDYPEADSVDEAGDTLYLYAGDELVGGFNPAAWSHYAIKQEAAR